MDGNLLCASVVNHNLKLGCGSNDLIVFSRVGRKLMTKCKFLRHTHIPLLAASLIMANAISFCPPPIDNSWKFYLPTTLSANSSSSFDGSLPAETTNKQGTCLVTSCSATAAKLNVYPETLGTCRCLHRNSLRELYTRSGRNV